ncbi:hypothetical protein GF362_02295 [Candidatus Dojkabacteria bacterium]|nr:hypothetical protein [Candidatus Dojkabacteria bacterium]
MKKLKFKKIDDKQTYRKLLLTIFLFVLVIVFSVSIYFVHNYSKYSEIKKSEAAGNNCCNEPDYKVCDEDHEWDEGYYACLNEECEKCGGASWGSCNENCKCDPGEDHVKCPSDCTDEGVDVLKQINFDFNLDEILDLSDFTLFAEGYKICNSTTTESPQTTEECKDYKEADRSYDFDFNEDTWLDLKDFVHFVEAYKVCNSTTQDNSQDSIECKKLKGLGPEPTCEISPTSTAEPTSDPTDDPSPTAEPTNPPDFEDPEGSTSIGGDFEGEFYHDGAPELYIAKDWKTWYEDGCTAGKCGTFNCDGSPAYCRRPEFKKADGTRFRNRVRTGQYSQQWFNTFGTHNAGIYRKVNVGTDKQLKMQAYGSQWTDDGSGGSTIMNGRIGIDPTGGTDPNSDSVIWTDWTPLPNVKPEDSGEWKKLEIEATSEVDEVTIFIMSNNQYPLTNNDVYWDDVILYIDGEKI